MNRTEVSIGFVKSYHIGEADKSNSNREVGSCLFRLLIVLLSLCSRLDLEWNRTMSETTGYHSRFIRTSERDKQANRASRTRRTPCPGCWGVVGVDEGAEGRGGQYSRWKTLWITLQAVIGKGLSSPFILQFSDKYNVPGSGLTQSVNRARFTTNWFLLLFLLYLTQPALILLPLL